MAPRTMNLLLEGEWTGGSPMLYSFVMTPRGLMYQTTGDPRWRRDGTAVLHWVRKGEGFRFSERGLTWVRVR